MEERIRKAVRKAITEGSQVRITFKQGAVIEVAYLLGMVDAGIVAFVDAFGQALYMAIVQSRSWSVDRNRTVTLSLTSQFNEDWFVGRMSRALENIEAVTS